MPEQICLNCKYVKENNDELTCEKIFEGIIINCEDNQSNHAVLVNGNFSCVYFEVE